MNNHKQELSVQWFLSLSEVPGSLEI